MKPLGLIISPSHDTDIANYLTHDLKLDFDELDITHVGLVWLRRRMERERKSPPALMYRNQIVAVGRNRLKALQALRDWGIVERKDPMKELYG